MIDFVISEDKLSAIEIILKQAGIQIKRNVLLSEIRSRPLPEELKKERDRVIKHLEEFTWLRYSENRICEKGMDEHCEIRSEIKRMECNGG